MEAFDFVRAEGGIESEEKYPYKNQTGHDSPHRLNIFSPINELITFK